MSPRGIKSMIRLDDRQLVIDQYVAGKSVYQLTIDFKAGTTMIKGLLKRNGVHIRGRREARLLQDSLSEPGYTPTTEEIATESTKIKRKNHFKKLKDNPKVRHGKDALGNIRCCHIVVERQDGQKN